MIDMKEMENKSIQYLHGGVTTYKYALSAYSLYKVAKQISPLHAFGEGLKCIALPIADYVANYTGFSAIRTLTFLGVEGASFVMDPVSYLISTGVQYSVKEISDRTANYVITKAHIEDAFNKALVKVLINEAGNLGASKLVDRLHSTQAVKKAKRQIDKVKSHVITKAKLTIQSQLHAQTQRAVQLETKNDSSHQTDPTVEKNKTAMTLSLPNNRNSEKSTYEEQNTDPLPQHTSSFQTEKIHTLIVGEEGGEQKITNVKETYSAKAEGGNITQEDIITNGKLISSMPDTVVYAQADRMVEQTGDKKETLHIKEKYAVKDGLAVKTETVTSVKESEKMARKIKKYGETTITTIQQETEQNFAKMKEIKMPNRAETSVEKRHFDEKGKTSKLDKKTKIETPNHTEKKTEEWHFDEKGQTSKIEKRNEVKSPDYVKTSVEDRRYDEKGKPSRVEIKKRTETRGQIITKTVKVYHDERGIPSRVVIESYISDKNEKPSLSLMHSLFNRKQDLSDLRAAAIILLDNLVEVIDQAIIAYCECEIAKLELERFKTVSLEKDKKHEEIMEQEKKLNELQFAIKKQDRTQKIAETREKIEQLKLERKNLKKERNALKLENLEGEEKNSPLEKESKYYHETFFVSATKKINYLARKIVDIIAEKQLINEEQLDILRDYVAVILDERQEIILSTIGREQRDQFCQKIAEEISLSLSKIIGYENDLAHHSNSY
jgi:hypothetical protein